MGKKRWKYMHLKNNALLPDPYGVKKGNHRLNLKQKHRAWGLKKKRKGFPRCH